MAQLLWSDAGMVTRRISCDASDVVFVKAIVMAYDGLCCMFSDGGGVQVLASPRGREAELDRLVDDMRVEFAERGRRFESDDSIARGVATLEQML